MTTRSAFISIILVCLLSLGCQDDQHRRTITMWHFWSEPRQRAAIDSLIEEFERRNPGLDVQTTALSWADGKAKLQVAINAGTQPDVIHLGLDWFSEFDVRGVFASLPDSLQTDGRACRWVVNARALVSTDPTQSGSMIDGLCVSDPHNVIKRVLPLVWQRGSMLYLRTPLAQDLNDSLAMAVWQIVTQSPNAVRNQSRQLDEMLMRGQISSVITGAWIIDMANAQRKTNLHVVPIPSILNADVLSVSAKSTVQREAFALIGFLRQYQQARQLCIAVSDAGFPSDLATALHDSAFNANPLQRGLLQTALISRPLARTVHSLTIEPIIEEMLERCYRSTSLQEVRAIVRDAQARVTSIESH